MNELFDILLGRPIAAEWMRGLLFLTFTLHMFFVLVTIGTAILAVYYFIQTWWGGRLKELRWDKEILRTFLAHKSLAVVLGVAPLLLLQVGSPLPLLSAINLHAPFWMLIIPLLVVAFLCLDSLGQRIYTHHYVHLVLGTIGLVSLLAVPGIFVAVLVTYEHPDQWLTSIRDDHRLTGPLAVHWLFRYLHVLGAGVVFAAAFHYLFSKPEEVHKRSSLLRWFTNGMIVQFVLGMLLYATLPTMPDAHTNACVLVGVIASAVLLWLLVRAREKPATMRLGVVVSLLMLVLVPMLLARQFLQDRQLAPLARQLDSAADAARARLAPFEKAALAHYDESLAISYSDPETMYRRSCAFCHGHNGDGRGPEAGQLQIPPENLAAIRTDHKHLTAIVRHGVPGTGMPYFSFFDGDKLDKLIGYLDARFGVLKTPEPVTAEVPLASQQRAEEIFATTCSVCHGTDGRLTELSRGFEPPPPDFSVHQLAPRWAFEVITRGYPGTMMPGFPSLPEDVRWGLVKIVQQQRKPDRP